MRNKLKKLLALLASATISFSTIAAAQDYFQATGIPVQRSAISSAEFRTEFASIESMISDRLPPYTANANNFVVVNAGATALTSITNTAALTSLGIAIGTDVQAWDTDLDAIAALADTDSNFIVGNGTAWVAETGATARASLGADNAANLTSGSLADARLSSNVPLKNATETISANWTFAGTPTVSGIAPELRIDETDAAVDNGRWDVIANGEELHIRSLNDAGSIATTFIQANRTGTTIDTLDLSATNVRVRSASTLSIWDTANTDNIAISHTGSGVNITHTNSNWLQFVDTTATPIRFLGTTATNWTQFGHDDTDFNITGTNTTDINITGISGSLDLLAGVGFRVRDSLNSSYMSTAASASALTHTAVSLDYIDYAALGVGLRLRDGGSLTILDSADTDAAVFSHDGINFITNYTNTTYHQFRGLTGVELWDGASLRIYDGTNIDLATFSHDGTDFNTAFTTTTDWNLTGITNFNLGSVVLLSAGANFSADVNVQSGNDLFIFDSTNTDNVAFSHDGTDFNIAGTNTTDINITGVTAVNINGSEVLTGGSSVTLFKTADESATSDVILSDDTHLAGWTLAAATRYTITGFIAYTENVGNLRFAWQVSNAVQSGRVTYSASDNSSTGADAATQTGFTDELFFTNLIDGDEMGIIIAGSFLTHATLTATLDFQWAQGTSSVNPTTLYDGSWIKVAVLQ